MKREPPAEHEIADLIAPAFDRLPAPDPERLAAIERRLPTTARPRRRAKFAWWWLAAALAAGAASALWWTMYYDSGKDRQAPTPSISSPWVAPSAIEPPVRPNRSEGVVSKPAREPENDRSPLIFKREQ